MKKKVAKKVTKKASSIAISNEQDYIGKCLFFRTVTYHVLGKVKKVVDLCGTKYFLLEPGSSWVASSGRFGNAINTGELDEVEVIDKAQHLVNPAACSDILEWDHPLPTKTK